MKWAEGDDDPWHSGGFDNVTSSSADTTWVAERDTYAWYQVCDYAGNCTNYRFHLIIKKNNSGGPGGGGPGGGGSSSGGCCDNCSATCNGSACYSVYHSSTGECYGGDVEDCGGNQFLCCSYIYFC